MSDNAELVDLLDDVLKELKRMNRSQNEAKTEAMAELDDILNVLNSVALELVTVSSHLSTIELHMNLDD